MSVSFGVVVFLFFVQKDIITYNFAFSFAMLLHLVYLTYCFFDRL